MIMLLYSTCKVIELSPVSPGIIKIINKMIVTNNSRGRVAPLVEDVSVIEAVVSVVEPEAGGPSHVVIPVTLQSTPLS